MDVFSSRVISLARLQTRPSGIQYESGRQSDIQQVRAFKRSTSMVQASFNCHSLQRSARLSPYLKTNPIHHGLARQLPRLRCHCFIPWALPHPPINASLPCCTTTTAQHRVERQRRNPLPVPKGHVCRKSCRPLKREYRRRPPHRTRSLGNQSVRQPSSRTSGAPVPESISLYRNHRDKA
jgi:hypothetical protein